jgi:putative DNA primase/helicase
MIALAGPLCAAHPDDFDKDPWLLNLLNGTLDLRSGRLRPHKPQDLITKLAPVQYDPQAKAPTWRAFLERIFAGNQSLIRFVQKTHGYALTGDAREQCLFIEHGAGSNGKSTKQNVISGILGDYACSTPAETLLTKRQEYIPNDIARLKGARFVTSIESAEGRKLNEPLIKTFTGGDRITARFLHREFFEFMPTFKIFIATNHKPMIRGGDHAIWRRIRLIPFTVTIPEGDQDKELPRKLLTEAPGILNWLIEGCLAWQREGLGVPDEVRTATEDYRVEMDILTAFITDCCVTGDGYRTGAAYLYGTYRGWCADNREDPLSQRAFGLALGERGFKKTEDRRGRVVWAGVGLMTPDGGTTDLVTDDRENADHKRGNMQTTDDDGPSLQVFSSNRPYIGENPEQGPSRSVDSHENPDLIVNTDNNEVSSVAARGTSQEPDSEEMINWEALEREE